MSGEYEWENGSHCSWLCTAISSGLYSTVAEHTSLIEDDSLHGLHFSAKKAEQVQLSTLFYSHYRNLGGERDE